MKEVASASGTAMFQDGERLLVVQRGGPGIFVAIFVFALITGILGLNGILQLVMTIAGSGGIWQLGIVLTAVACVTGVVLWMLLRKRQRAKQTPPESLPVLCVFDFASGNLLNAQGNAMAKIADVVYGRRFQLGSSSPALVIRWGGHSVLLAKGSPFGGGIGDLEFALQQRGVARG